MPLSQLSQGPQPLIDFDAEITREDKDILESINPDALGDLRRRGVEYSMDSDRPGILIWRKMMVLLASHGESEVHRNAGAGRIDHVNTAATESAGAAGRVGNCAIKIIAAYACINWAIGLSGLKRGV